MNPHRKLALRREALAELDGGQLRSVAGGTHIWTDCGCVTHGYSCEVCPVPSLPINTCLCGPSLGDICWVSPATRVICLETS